MAAALLLSLSRQQRQWHHDHDHDHLLISPFRDGNDGGT
jgi:hypothetical protein